MKKNRGMLLESIVNKTINYYTDNNIAYIEKKELPIKFRKVVDNKNLENAFIFKKSTVDYIGCYKGRFIAFEAKTTNENLLPKSNIPNHQINYLRKIEENGGVSFLLIFFSSKDEFYVIKTSDFIMQLKKSISYENIKQYGFKLELCFPGIIDFLPFIDNSF
ncbi:Holliday junction resolvase RecU [Mycoplasma sp. Mirounga ES2805-ORL]|uniref:Holliday junction resolvase RecU n=1 Tax=Mycoplasma sp. Mirounga ES2805-ORL TaxID=754514 RepID=UPI00197BDD1A|nr:Holliday junction resolvase RecU [Mycoplasma sp. Mirounga ES2805-ORL]QSF13645.1 Holliday junction resolvase RecU [Mycoplasma sp. Mirounga ES2805-ORL]